jgi:hypothetical protein
MTCTRDLRVRKKPRRLRMGVWVAKPPQRAAKPRRNDDGETGSRFPRTCLAIDNVRRQGLEPRTR